MKRLIPLIAALALTFGAVTAFAGMNSTHNAKATTAKSTKPKSTKKKS
jgi:hypothetical protein